MDEQRILVIGDSHSNLFSSNGSILFPNNSIHKRKTNSGSLTAVFIGSYIIHGLDGKVSEIVSVFNLCPDSTHIILCFGEIDCRAHLPKFDSNVVLKIEELCFKYCDVVEVVSEKTKIPVSNIIVYGPIAQVPNIVCGEISTIKDMRERNEITSILNRELRQASIDRGFGFFTIFDDLVDEKNDTRMEYYMDAIHIGINGKGLLAKRAGEIGLDLS